MAIPNPEEFFDTVMNKSVDLVIAGLSTMIPEQELMSMLTATDKRLVELGIAAAITETVNELERVGLLHDKPLS